MWFTPKPKSEEQQRHELVDARFLALRRAAGMRARVECLRELVAMNKVPRAKHAEDLVNSTQALGELDDLAQQLEARIRGAL